MGKLSMKRLADMAVNHRIGVCPVVTIYRATTAAAWKISPLTLFHKHSIMADVWQPARRRPESQQKA